MYVGFTSKSIEHRFRMHKAKARKSSYYLYNAMRKHGIENFTIEAIYQSNHLDHTLHVMEKYFIEQYGTHYSTDGGYNMTYGGEGTMGLSPWNKGIKMSDGHCNKLSDSHMGIAHTVETRTKMSETRTGMIKSFEHRNNLSLSLRGKNVPTHRRKLISETLKNKPKLTIDQIT